MDYNNKSISIISNPDVWNVDIKKEDSKEFLEDLEELKKGDKKEKRLRQIEDYDDEVCDENISVEKSEQLQHISNDCKQNNLKILSQKVSASPNSKPQMNQMMNKEVNNIHINNDDFYYPEKANQDYILNSDSKKYGMNLNKIISKYDLDHEDENLNFQNRMRALEYSNSKPTTNFSNQFIFNGSIAQNLNAKGAFIISPNSGTANKFQNPKYNNTNYYTQNAYGGGGGKGIANNPKGNKTNSKYSNYYSGKKNNYQYQNPYYKEEQNNIESSKITEYSNSNEKNNEKKECQIFIHYPSSNNKYNLSHQIQVSPAKTEQSSQQTQKNPPFKKSNSPIGKNININSQNIRSNSSSNDKPPVEHFPNVHSSYEKPSPFAKSERPNTQGYSNSNEKGNSHTAKKNKAKDVITSKVVKIEDIIAGVDKRTTMMLRNIPNKYTIANLVDEINVAFRGKYDFINLPIDYDRKLNLGYAFINFVDPLHIILFYETYRLKKWDKYRSEKKLQFSYAEKQGKKDANCKDDQTYFAADDNRFDFASLNPKIEIPIAYLELFKQVYPNSVYTIEEKPSYFTDKCFVVKSLGRRNIIRSVTEHE